MAAMHSIAPPSRRRTIHTDAFAIVIWRALPAMLCMVLVVFVPGAASAACPSTRPAFQTLRYEEDYSFLRDPDCRTDVWDRIKYMPLNWRESRDDGIYNSALVLLRSARASQARFIGHQAEVQLEWRIDRHLSLTVNYAHFFAGPFLKDTGPAHDVDYASGWVTYRL